MPQISKRPAFKRVAAYARVSTSSEEQLNSVEAQKSYYKEYIGRHKEWVFAGLYTDEGREASEMFHSEATAFFDAFATV